MNRTRLSLFTLLALALTCFCAPPGVLAQGSSDLTIEVGVICKQIEERAPVDADSTFAVTVEKLYCFTKITGAEEATMISHVWYWGEIERARIELPVRSISWRTYTAKKILRKYHETVEDLLEDVLEAERQWIKTKRY